ncbi:MAG TPA: metallophosphoesterase [Solirubrobacteraceae bacterium]|nr:metallophosphoesterase [Solirubrobacteraceae bacterium]
MRDMASTLPDEAPAAPTRHGRPWRVTARAVTVLVVIAATLAGGYFALVSFREDRQLSIGGIHLSVSPGHTGSLDVYVPLVDWGARFESIRLPVRLRVDVRTVDRNTLQRVADGGSLDISVVRTEARDAIASYLRGLIAVVAFCGLSLGLLTAFAVRNRAGPRLRYTVAAAGGATLAMVVGLVALLPPRGQMDTPQYYAYGADIPRALDAVASVRRSGRSLDQELDAQLVGLARLVIAPAGRTPVEGRPRVTIASDLHNNVITLPILERAAGEEPVLFPGDLSDRGSPLETALVARVARIGRPFVFVTGNHDSDRSAQDLADDGAIVLTQFGRLKRGGGYGPVINEVAPGLRVAGYGDPFERKAAEDYRDRFTNTITPEQQADFSDWLRPLIGKVDVVMVHEPALITQMLAELKRDPPAAPLVFVVGHTHHLALERQQNVDVINGGSLGGGGTGNLTDGSDTDVSLARMSYVIAGGFEPLAVDLVGIDPGTGAATARRDRLDEPATPP